MKPNTQLKPQREVTAAGTEEKGKGGKGAGRGWRGDGERKGKGEGDRGSYRSAAQ